MPIDRDDISRIPQERANSRADLLIFLASHDAKCPMCEYNLRGLTGVQCPECQWVFDLAALRAAWTPPDPPPLAHALRRLLCAFYAISAVVVAVAIMAGGRPSPLTLPTFFFFFGSLAVSGLLWPDGRNARLWKHQPFLWLSLWTALWLGLWAISVLL